MIFIHEGNPGAGKSYDIQVRIIDQLKAGRIVYSNIDGHDDQRCRQAIGDIVGCSRSELDARFRFLTDADVSHFWEICEPGSFIVIDEIHKWFNARDWSAGNNRLFSDWCSTHRHQGFDLCMITQRQNKIDGQARSMVEWRYFYRKLNFFGSLFSKGYLIYCYSGDDQKPLSVRKATYDSKYFKCYHSYKGNVIERKVVKNQNILRHPAFYALACVIVLCGYFFSKSTFRHGDVLGMSKSQEKITATIKQLKSGQPVTGESGKQALAEGGEVAAFSPSIVPVSLLTLPITMYLRTSDGLEVVYVGSYKLSTWKSLDITNKLVTVYSNTVPQIVLQSLPSYAQL